MRRPEIPVLTQEGSGPPFSEPKPELHRCGFPAGENLGTDLGTVGTETACRLSGATERQARWYTTTGHITLRRVGNGFASKLRWDRQAVAHLAAIRALTGSVADITTAARIGRVAACCACDPAGDRYVIAGRDHIVTTDDPAAAARLVDQLHGVITVIDVRTALAPVLAAFDQETAR